MLTFPEKIVQHGPEFLYRCFKIFGPVQRDGIEAVEIVEGITKKVVVGEEYEGEVIKIVTDIL